MTGNRRALPVPRRWSLRTRDIVAVLVLNGLLIAAMWLRHGGLDQLADPSGWFIALGELVGLYGGYLALIQLVLMSRSPWLEHVVGRDNLAAAHRWVGFVCVWLIVGHVLLTTIGFAIADGQNLVVEAWTLLTTYEFMLMAGVSLVLFIGVAVSSVRVARRHLSYETWHGLHFYAYLAIALGLGHQLVTGSDFAHDPIAWAYWLGLYVIAAALIVGFRFVEPLLISVRHQFRVVNVEDEGPGVVSIYLGGRDLDQFAIRAGQFVIVRFLVRDGWWRGHPFSISAAPNGRWLRLTIKEFGGDTMSMASLAIGTRVYLEGPYGLLTGAQRVRRRVLLIAGGIGITPLRALFEETACGPGRLDPRLSSHSARRYRLSGRAGPPCPSPRRGRPLPDRRARFAGDAGRPADSGGTAPARPRPAPARGLPVRPDADDGGRSRWPPGERVAARPDPLRTLRILNRDNRA